jgi:ethanolaminephosphotransferase
MRNARQILDIVLAAFGHEILDSDSDASALTESKADYQELAHGWKALANNYAKNVGCEDCSELTTAITKVRPGHGIADTGTDNSQWLQHAQSVLSSMASNYDMSRLFMGQAAAVLALIAAVIAAARCVKDRAVSFTPLSGISLAYGVMMFASSYVEEEHHFWYWAMTAWFAYLGVRGLKR